MEDVKQTEQRKLAGDRSFEKKPVVQSSHETRDKETVRCLGNFWPMDAFIKQKGRKPTTAEITEEEDEDGKLVMGVLVPRDKDDVPDNQLPAVVRQIFKRRKQGVGRKQVVWGCFFLGQVESSWQVGSWQVGLVGPVATPPLKFHGNAAPSRLKTMVVITTTRTEARNAGTP